MSAFMTGSGKFVPSISHISLSAEAEQPKVVADTSLKAAHVPEGGVSLRKHIKIYNDSELAGVPEVVADSIPPVPKSSSSSKALQFLEENFGKYWIVTAVLAAVVLYKYLKK